MPCVFISLGWCGFTYTHWNRSNPWVYFYTIQGLCDGSWGDMQKTSLPDVQQCNQIVVINKEPTPSKFSWVRQQIYWEYFQLHRWWLTYISIGNSRAEGHFSEKPTQHDWQETCIPKVPWTACRKLHWGVSFPTTAVRCFCKRGDGFPGW